MVTFANTVQPTAFGLYDSDAAFITDADGMVVFVKRMLGDDVLQVELTKKEIWTCMERATSEWGSIINQYQAKSHLTNYLGSATGSVDVSNLYPRNTLEFVLRQAEPYAIQANLGGSYTQVLGKLPLTVGVQDYNLHTDLLDASGSVVYDTQPDSTKQRLRVMEVFHFSPTTAYRFFDSTSATNYLNNEFSFESFTPETIFYVLPVFEDILRAQQMKTSFNVRRSHYNYQIFGNGHIRIMPLPTKTPPGNLFVRVAFAQSPVDAGGAGAGSGGAPGAQDTDSTITAISSISNIPYGVIPYASVNEIGKQFIREMTLGYSKELLGIIRTKTDRIPIPGAEVTLNGEALKSEAREDQERIKEKLTALLEETTYDKLLEKDAAKAENMLKMLRMVPMPGGGAITRG